MKNYIKVATILFLICACASLLLAVINNITAPQIAANIQINTEKALSAVSSGFTIGEKREGDGGNINYVISLTDGSGKLAGYILELKGAGYGGAFTLVASYDKAGVLLDAKMMGNSETPGLGKKSEEAWYMQMFKGKGDATPLPLKKSDLSSEQASAVSGASVTFGAVSRALNLGSTYVNALGGK